MLRPCNRNVHGNSLSPRLIDRRTVAAEYKKPDAYVVRQTATGGALILDSGNRASTVNCTYETIHEQQRAGAGALGFDLRFPSRLHR